MPRPKNSKFGKSGWLALLTFLSVSGTMFLAGLVIVPWLIREMEQRYLLIQADINARQAKSYSRFVQTQLEKGVALEDIQKDLGDLFSGADADLGYSCVVSRDTTTYVSHPMAQAVGMSVSSKQAAFGEIENRLEVYGREPWEIAIARGAAGPGTLLYPSLASEIVHMEHIPGTLWTVSTHENTAKVQAELADLRTSLILGAGIIGLVLAIPSSLAARAVGSRHEKRLERERARSERLLLNILPSSIAERLKDKEQVIADRHPQVTVLFADVVGFTPLAAQTSAEELVKWLNRIFSQFDDICVAHDLEKIKTIGDAYMLCGGLAGDADDAAVRVVSAGLEMMRAIDELPQGTNHPKVELRIGVHTGELVAGVIGKRKFSYDVWGDVVNTASRLESNGVPGRIQVSRETAAKIDERFSMEARGALPIKGKGEMELWLVEDPKNV